MMATILNSSILNSAILDSAICTKLWLKLIQSDSNSFILTQLDDISHLEFCHVGFRHCHLGFKHIFSQIHWKTLSPSTLTLTQTNSIWLTWWWQPSWILPCWIQRLPSWIQTPCYLLSDSLCKKHSHSILTLTQTNSIWLKLIHSHLTWWWQPSWILPSWIQTLPSWIQTLVIFSQIHSKTLFLHSDPDSN